MKYLPFIASLFVTLCACSKEDVEEVASTRSSSNTDTIQTASEGITFTIDTTWIDTLHYNF